VELPVEGYMRIAIDEARLSLGEGNHGFGAVIVQDKTIVCKTHDTEETEKDPTAHAEMKAIRKACAILGKDLSACRLFCTHEPCPMCATAIVWSHLAGVTYGYGIEDSIKQGRKRIDLSCAELFRRAKSSIQVESGLLLKECSPLYDRRVRDEVRRLNGASSKELTIHDEKLSAKRVAWFRTENPLKGLGKCTPVDLAYRLLLMKLEVAQEQAPIVRRTDTEIVFHSMNFCSTLEACRILGLDTRTVCKLYNERSTAELIQQIDPHLHFTRNYGKLRPRADYCEEIITYE
jgi:tRNA(Arg) A34 adenosine deaminase TadA